MFKLSDYFTLRELLGIKKEFEDSKEFFEETIAKATEEEKSTQEIWEVILDQVHRINNFQLENKDQAREVKETGTTEYLDITCGDFEKNGYAVILSILDNGLLEVSSYITVDKKGEDSLFDSFTLNDLNKEIEELKEIMTKLP